MIERNITGGDMGWCQLILCEIQMEGGFLPFPAFSITETMGFFWGSSDKKSVAEFSSD